MATFNGFDEFEYSEADRGNPSPRVYYTTDGMRMIRDILVRPNPPFTGMVANYSAAKAFMGFPTLITVRDNAGTFVANYVSRSLPDVATWTDFPDALIAVSIENQQGVPPGVRIEGELPWNDDLRVNEFPESQMTVEYRSTNYSIEPDSFIFDDDSSIPGEVIPGYFQRTLGRNFPDEGLMLRYIDRPEWNYSSKITTLPVGVLATFPDAGDGWPVELTNKGNATKGGTPIREPMLELTYIHRELPISAVPNDAILNSLGCMNGVYVDDADPTSEVNNFDPPFWNIPPYCALFTGARPHVGKLITGEAGVNMEYKFLVAPNVVRYGSEAGTLGGWRRILDVIPSAQGTAGALVDYRQLYAVWTGGRNVAQFPIRTADFSKLFRPPQP